MAPDPAAIEAIADKLIKAENPMFLTEYTGRQEGNFDKLVTLAETAGAAVWDVNNALNFPNKHPLCLSMDKPSLKKLDLIVGLDLKDWEKQITNLNRTTRTLEVLPPKTCDYVEIGVAEIGISKWAMDYCRFQPCSVRALGDTSLAMPELTRIIKAKVDSNSNLKKKIEDRKIAIGKRHDEVWAQWAQEARKDWDSRRLTFARLALEVWKSSRRGLGAHRQRPQARGAQALGLRQAYATRASSSHPTQIGISLCRFGTPRRSGRVVVDIQPDGDLMFDAGALWIAAKYQIPMLVVMHNNRAYYNDWEHQIRMAQLRGTDEAKAHIGMDLFGPEPDFAALARSLGCYGEGPIDKPEDVQPALRRAIAEVKKGRLALVDTLTQHKGGATGSE
jgi:acetolactate synthase-1/2/3 large subunit